MQYYNTPVYYRNEDNRSLLLPILLGAAVGFPFGYIASNTNKQQVPYYPQPMYQQPIPYPVNPMPYYQPNYYIPY